jgi:hypothetical protein
VTALDGDTLSVGVISTSSVAAIDIRTRTILWTTEVPRLARRLGLTARYSCWSATMGATVAARIAGSRVARRDAMTSTAIASR